MEGRMTVMLDEQMTEDPKEVYCSVLEDIRQLFRSGDLELLDGVDKVDFKIDRSDDGLCTRNDGALEPRWEGRETAAIESETTNSVDSGLGTKQLVIIVVFSVAGVFALMAAVIVGRRVLSNPRHSDSASAFVVSHSSSEAHVEHEDEEDAEKNHLTSS